jgi:hypothetical protein
MGRAYRERRHYSHITITVSSEREAEAERKKQGTKAASKTSGPASKSSAPASKSAAPVGERPVEERPAE